MRLPKGLSIVPIKDLIVARLYNTNIVTIDHSTNTITFNSGGWKTNHTKKCINLVLRKYNYNMYLYQKNFDWYLECGDKRIEFNDQLEVSI